MDPARIPVAVALFAAWKRNRGDRIEPAAAPFSRHWEDLLEIAGILSAIDRQDAERDARALEADGWIILKAVRNRPHFIDRIAIPLEAEGRWCEAFGFVPPTAVDTRRILEFPWAPAMAFVREARTYISFDDLRKLNDFLSRVTGTREPSIPIKERSLELFGDEKRFDLLVDGSLFQEGRLSLEMFRCYKVTEPLGWVRGLSNAGPLIVLENAATWDSYRRWNQVRGIFSAVIYGQGNCFAERVRFLEEIYRELGGIRPVQYFGDLDAAGLRIPARASRVALRSGLPPIEPHLESYRWLLTRTPQAIEANDTDPACRGDFDWLASLAEEAWLALGPNRRLAQEHVGWEFLSNCLTIPETSGIRQLYEA